MNDLDKISEQEAAHQTYDVFLFALEALASPPELQCQLIGDFNTALELKDTVLAGHFLLEGDFFDPDQAAAVRQLLDAVARVPADSLPRGTGRAVNLRAMHNRAWAPLREQAQALMDRLAPVTAANRAYLDSLQAA